MKQCYCGKPYGNREHPKPKRRKPPKTNLRDLLVLTDLTLEDRAGGRSPEVGERAALIRLERKGLVEHNPAQSSMSWGTAWRATHKGRNAVALCLRCLEDVR